MTPIIWRIELFTVSVAQPHEIHARPTISPNAADRLGIGISLEFAGRGAQAIAHAAGYDGRLIKRGREEEPQGRMWRELDILHIDDVR
jgi:hypothetical protein